MNANLSPHTPGRWVFDSEDNCIVSDTNRAISICTIDRIDAGDEGRYYFGDETAANARLIAAAPVLLKACQQALYALKGREHDQFLRDAIAAATSGVA